MKSFVYLLKVILLLAFLTSFEVIAQSNDYADFRFFNPESECSFITLKCNFVVINRDDGTGNIPVDSELWDYWANKMNESMSEIKDIHGCGGNEYPLDSRIRFDFDVFEVNDSEAYDWYAETIEDALPSTEDPTGYVCPEGIQDRWEDLDATIKKFQSEHPGELSFFFVENGEEVDSLESMIANGTEPIVRYRDRFEISGAWDHVPSGCASFNNEFFSIDNDNVFIIPEVYSEYLIRNNFHAIWYPQVADSPAEQVWQWYVNDRVLLYIHELGHNFFTQGHEGNCGNVMCEYNCEGDGKRRSNYMNATQLERMHRNLASRDLRNAILCDKVPSQTCPVFIKSSTTIHEPLNILGDLIIESGVVVTVKDTIYLGESSRIIVKEGAVFRVIGGKLTSGACSDTWKGISVYGGADNYDVQIRDAVIENTSEAAVSMFAPEPYPEVMNWENGVLWAKNSIFNNTNRMVNFASWSTQPNKSYVKNCVQNGGFIGIFNLNCQGIEVSGNEFNEIQQECIISSSGSFNLIDNTFDANEHDVLFYSTYSGIGSLIENNKFVGANIGFRTLGTTTSQHQIHDNEFYNPKYSFLSEGHNQFDFSGNEVYDAIVGVVCLNNGNGIADVHNNEFIGNWLGIVTNGVNNDFNFYENCFETTVQDVSVYGNVSPIIAYGNTINAAYNCFTHDGNKNANVPDLGGNHERYIYMDVSVDDKCYSAILANENVERKPSSIMDVQGTCNKYEGPQMVQNLQAKSLDELWDEFNELITQYEYTDKSKNIVHRRKIRRIRDKIAEYYLLESEELEIIDLYKEASFESDYIFLFSNYVHENKLDDALEYILKMENVDMAQDVLKTEFAAIQGINIRRIKDGSEYVLDSKSQSLLLDITNSRSPNSGFARSLLYELTGILDAPIVEFGDLYTGPAYNDQSNNLLLVYPNPIENTLNVKIETLEAYRIDIFDIWGNELYSEGVLSNETLKLDIGDWTGSVFYLNLYDQSKVISRRKIIRIE